MISKPPSHYWSVFYSAPGGEPEAQFIPKPRKPEAWFGFFFFFLNGGEDAGFLLLWRGTWICWMHSVSLPSAGRCGHLDQ